MPTDKKNNKKIKSDDFIKYINDNLKIISDHFRLSSENDIMQQNNHLYYFTKISMECIDKNNKIDLKQ